VPDDPRDLRSRSDDRRERRTSEERLMALAESLAGLTDRALAKLSLPEEVQDALQNVRMISSATARNRALRTLRTALRAVDSEQIDKQIANSHGAPRPVSSAAAGIADWCARLTADGDAALDAFLAACPDADRQQLRNLCRNVMRASEADRPEAARALARVVARHLP